MILWAARRPMGVTPLAGSGSWFRGRRLVGRVRITAGNRRNVCAFPTSRRGLPMPRWSLRLSTAVVVLLVAGCGGGSGGGGGGGGGNSAPAFTSAATASVVENAAGTVLTATASDPDGDTVSFSIGGGADAALFQITPAGALSFRTPPDFEAPADADLDNVYEVRLAAS